VDASDVWNGRLAVRVDCDEPAVRLGQPRGFDVQPFQVGNASERAKELFGAHRFARGKLGSNFAEAVPSHADDATVALEAAIARFEVPNEAARQLGIEKSERSRPLVDHDHLHAERGEDGRVLAGDDTGAEHGKRSGKIAHRQNRVAVENVLVIDGYPGRRARNGPSGDDHVFGMCLSARAADGPDFDDERLGKARFATPDMDAVAAQLIGDVALVPADNGVEPQHQAADLEIVAHRDFEHRPAPPLKAAQRERGLPQRLARHGALVHAGTADLGFAFDDEHGGASLGALDGRLLPCGPAADDDEIEGIHAIAATMSITRCRKSKSLSTSSG